jgi:hypothetical protein
MVATLTRHDTVCRSDVPAVMHETTLGLCPRLGAVESPSSPRYSGPTAGWMTNRRQQRRGENRQATTDSGKMVNR